MNSLLLGVLSFTSVAACADLTAGIAAFERKDYQHALQELEPLARAGIAPAEHYFGMMLDNGWGVAKDRARAAMLIQQSAQKGFAKAQAVMGFAHFTGTWLLGVAKDDGKSFQWFLVRRNRTTPVHKTKSDSAMKRVGV